MLNWDYLNEVTNGDNEFIAELLSEFLNLAPELIGQIEQAIVQGDAHALTHAAHTLKGSARSVGAESFAHHALALEQMGRSAQLQHAPDALRSLNEQWEQLQRYLSDWLRQEGASVA
ncbi:MAG: Hpt domain-containing protein [Fimbriimonadales bacterium]|nr:Hpt domain-containing protein [Fimbriimonadales bacterium]